jgi:hypothetical protein
MGMVVPLVTRLAGMMGGDIDSEAVAVTEPGGGVQGQPPSCRRRQLMRRGDPHFPRDHGVLPALGGLGRVPEVGPRGGPPDQRGAQHPGPAAVVMGPGGPVVVQTRPRAVRRGGDGLAAGAAGDGREGETVDGHDAIGR